MIAMRLLDLIAFANRLADASGAVIRPFFRQRIDVVHKQGGHAFDPVTEADRGAERALRDLIGRERPDDAILGEEFGETPAKTAIAGCSIPWTAPAPSSPAATNGAR